MAEHAFRFKRHEFVSCNGDQGTATWFSDVWICSHCDCRRLEQEPSTLAHVHIIRDTVFSTVCNADADEAWGHCWGVTHNRIRRHSISCNKLVSHSTIWLFALLKVSTSDCDEITALRETMSGHNCINHSWFAVFERHRKLRDVMPVLSDVERNETWDMAREDASDLTGRQQESSDWSKRANLASVWNIPVKRTARNGDHRPSHCRRTDRIDGIDRRVIAHVKLNLGI